MDKTKVGAVILAAGESQRMGYPKALAKLNNQPFLSVVLNTFRVAGVGKVIAVLGAYSNEIISSVNFTRDEYTINENFQDGQFSSFQAGVRVLNNVCQAGFLALVDQPQISATVVSKLLQAYKNLPDNILIPTASGKRGHPTLFPASLFPTILDSPAHITARDIISDFESIVSEIDVDDEAILWNINDEKELNDVVSRLKLKEETWGN